MSITIGTIAMQGMNGTIQSPKPVFEKFVGLGDTQPYIQRLRTESKESQVTLWSIVNNDAGINTIIEALRANLGVPLEATIDGVELDYNVYLLDYTFNIRAGANSKQLIEVEATFITSDKEE